MDGRSDAAQSQFARPKGVNKLVMEPALPMTINNFQTEGGIQMINSVIMHEKDTVVTVTEAVSIGEDVSYNVNGQIFTVKAISNIPIYHKIAVKSIKKGSEVFKYGERIGYATVDISKGDHVHVNNLDS